MLGDRRHSCRRPGYIWCSSGNAGESARKTHSRRRRPSQRDAVVHYSIGDSAGGQSNGARQVRDLIEITSTILGIQLPRWKDVVLCVIEPAAPTLITLIRRGCEWLRIVRVKNVCPGSGREVKMTCRRTGSLIGRPIEPESSEHKLTLEGNITSGKKRFGKIETRWRLVGNNRNANGMSIKKKQGETI